MALPLQQSVNQLFHLASFATMANPAIQGKVKQRQETKQATENVAKRKEALESALTAMDEGKYPGMKDPSYKEQVTKELQSDVAQAEKELFKISPSAETAQPYVERKFVEAANEAGRKRAAETPIEPGDPEWIEGVEAEAAERQRAEQFESDVQAILHPQEQVMSQMAQKGTQQVQQARKRRDFMKFLRENPDTKNLGPGALKQISSKLSKTEKTKMMDEAKYGTGGKK